MAIVTTDNQYYTAIANAINEKLSASTPMYPSEMAEKILSIAGGLTDYYLIYNYGGPNPGLTFVHFIGGQSAQTEEILWSKIEGKPTQFLSGVFTASHDNSVEMFTIVINDRNLKSTWLPSGIQTAPSSIEFKDSATLGYVFI